MPLADVTRIIAIGSDRMMNAVRLARHGALAPHLNPQHVGIGSINSPMQCMMKEVCAQCLQRHVDPETGREEFIFSCYNQDQDLDRVDFANLQARLRQNSVQEKISNLWFEHLLDRAEAELDATCDLAARHRSSTAATRSSGLSAPAAWGRCIAPAGRCSATRWRSR